MRRVLEKCKKLMNDKQINAGVIQVNKAIRSMEQSGRQKNMNIKEEEELALRHFITGIVPEWQEVNEKEKRDDNNNESMDWKDDELGKNTDESVDGKEE
eukprot:6199349-Pleurochrysis_carterae.AAC.2